MGTSVVQHEEMLSPGHVLVSKPTLRPQIAALREAALRGNRGCDCPILLLSDARAWQSYTPEEDWLLWRGYCIRNRLREMPIELSPGERIAGRLELRARNEHQNM